MTEGWLCPRCNSVNAPSVKKCDCSAEQKATSEDDFMDLIRKIADGQRKQEIAPRYVPCPVYPYPWQQPGIIYTTTTATDRVALDRCQKLVSERAQELYRLTPYSVETSGFVARIGDGDSCPR
jgi:hypothetical protein